jgi:hypothetical protein
MNKKVKKILSKIAILLIVVVLLSGCNNSKFQSNSNTYTPPTATSETPVVTTPIENKKPATTPAEKRKEEIVWSLGILDKKDIVKYTDTQINHHTMEYIYVWGPAHIQNLLEAFDESIECSDQAKIQYETWEDKKVASLTVITGVENDYFKLLPGKRSKEVQDLMNEYWNLINEICTAGEDFFYYIKREDFSEAANVADTVSTFADKMEDVTQKAKDSFNYHWLSKELEDIENGTWTEQNK